MKTSKTYQLIKSLTKKDLDCFKEKNKKNKKRLHLLSVFINFMNTKKDFEIKEFYKKFYNEKYTKAKDNLLRNELRLLNGLLEDYIIDNQFYKQKKSNFYFKQKLYLNYLLDNNIFNLFEKEIIKVFKRIDDKEDYFDFYIFFELWTRFQNKTFSYDSHYFKFSKEFYHQGILKWFKEVSFKTRKLELFISFIERTNLQIADNVKISKPIEIIDITKANDSIYINFIEKKIKAFHSYNQEKLDALTESLEILKTLNNCYVNKANEEFTLLQTIGVEYMMHAKNEEASHYFKQVLDLKGKIGEMYFVKGLYNYINIEIKLKKFDEAIRLFTKYQTEISKSNLTELFNNVISMCYIFIGEIEKAEKLFTIISSTISTENNVYSRCNAAIIHFLNRNVDLALTELINIKQTINYYHLTNQAHSDFISTFKQFIQLLAIRFEIKQNKEKFVSIKNTILHNIKNSNEKYSGDSLHNLWLLNEIEKLIEKEIS